MPQLINIPYNHVYVSIFIIIVTGLLNYYKVLMPLSLKIIKFNMKSKLKSILVNLMYLNTLNSSSIILNLYFDLANYYLYSIDLNISKSIQLISKEVIQSLHITSFLINPPIFNSITQ